MAEVLLIDDDPSILDLLEVRLGGRGYQVAKCLSAQSGLDLMAQRSFEVVITDLRMKGMDGLELCKQVLAKQSGVPVIVMTGHGTMEAAIQAIRAGAVDFITKPIELDELWEALGRIEAAKNAPEATDSADDLPPLDEVERRHILRVLEATGGNKVRAARVLGFDRRTLYRKLEIYGLSASKIRRTTGP